MKNKSARIAFMVDLARQVETPQALRKIISWAADFGYNELFLYGEGGFYFTSHPGVSYPWAITPEEYRDLEVFAADFSMRLTPIIPLLGHASYIVKAPHLRHLNELQDSRQGVIRCDSSDLCISNPGTLQLAEDLIGEWAEVSNSPYLHVGGDEAWHFAQCPECRKRAEATGRSRMLAEYFNELNSIVKRHGRQMMIWHDMLFYYDNTLEFLDRDIVICLWHYKPIDVHPRISLYNHSAVPFADQLLKYGFELYFCSKSKYDYEYESANISSLLDYYSTRPALGYMNTVWCMKELPFASCLPALAYGAARAANPTLLPGAFLEDFSQKRFAGESCLPLLLECGRQAFEYPQFSSLNEWIDYQLPERHEALAGKMRSAIKTAERLVPLTESGEALREAMLLLFKRAELFALFKAYANLFALGRDIDFGPVLELTPNVLALERSVWKKFRPAKDRNPAESAIAKIPAAVESISKDGKKILPTVLNLSVANNDCAFQDISILAKTGTDWKNCGNSAQCGPFGEYKIFFPVPAGTKKVRILLSGLGELLIRYACLLAPGTCLKPVKISNAKGNVRNEKCILADDCTFLSIGNNANKLHLASGKPQPLSEFEITFAANAT